MTSRSETRRAFSPEGLKQVEKMVTQGYDRRELIPGNDGLPVFDPELSDFLRGKPLGRKPTEAEIQVAISQAWSA